MNYLIKIDRTQEAGGFIFVYADIEGEDNFGYKVEIYYYKSIKEDKREWKVNWSTLGMQKTDRARLYAELMLKAVEVAEDLNKELNK